MTSPADGNAESGGAFGAIGGAGGKSSAIGGGATATGGALAASGGSTPTGGSSFSAGGTNAAGTTGGNLGQGGAFATGGGTGGSKSSGGTVSSGGTTAGANSSGGAVSSGGALNIGGSKATGGNPNTSSPTGGSGATGGASATGGNKATGGTPTTGGNKATGGTTATGGSGQKCSVYIAGDSTVSTYTLTSSTKDQAGWGQMLQQYYDGDYVTVVNRAVGGMTARHFIQAGNLDAILTLLKPGDYFLVQFGTNDSNTTATYTLNGVTYPYFADANTDFKTYLQQYIDGAEAKNAIPVLVTPPPRNSAYCGGGRSMANYAQAMLDLGQADTVAVVDLSMKTWSYLNVICPKPADGTTENFFKVNADNTIDGTHFQENGAIIMASFVADGIGEAGLGLDAYRIK